MINYFANAKNNNKNKILINNKFFNTKVMQSPLISSDENDIENEYSKKVSKITFKKIIVYI